MNLRSIRSRLFPLWPKPDSETFILWEPCSHSHGEIVPGYAKYLLELGYKVLVLVTPARIDEGLFSRFSHPGLQVADLSQRRIRRFMRRPEIGSAAGVLITTAGKLPDRPDGRPDLVRVFGGHVPHRVLLVEHDARRRLARDAWDPHFITLRRINLDGVRSVVVNPHFFGTFPAAGKNRKTVFLIVGAARAKRRNQDLILHSAERLIAAGHVDFEIRMVGKSDGRPVPEALRDHVHTLGRIPFSRLYEEASTCDYILTAFQQDNPDHDFYRTTGTSGAFQLAYGFGRPCIVQEAFTEGTMLDRSNSLLYGKDEEMFDAMRAAILLSPEKHAELRQSMIAGAQDLHDRSLANLRQLMDGTATAKAQTDG